MVAPNVGFAMGLSKAWSVLVVLVVLEGFCIIDKVLLDTIVSGKGL